MTETTAAPVVLVALDGSPAAATAMPVASALAAQLGAHVTILHVAPAEMAIEEVRSHLGPAASGASGLELQVSRGEVAEAILEAATDDRVALLVMATHGDDIRLGAPLGEVARHVIAETSRPVLLVRPEATTPTAGRRPLRRLLFPVDGTPTTTESFRPAVPIAAPSGIEIDVLFVVYPHQTPPEERGSMSPPQYVDQPYLEWPAWHTRVAEWLLCHCDNLPRDTVIQSHVASARSRDDVGRVVAKFATEHEEDAIILVRRSHLEPGRAVILQSVIEQTPCPVLLLAGLEP